MDVRFEELKSELFNCGQEAVEDFLGYEIASDEDKDVTDRRMDMVYEQMPQDVLDAFYAKHKIGPVREVAGEMCYMNEMERLTRQAERIKETYPPGTRIYLENMDDRLSPVPSGTRGTVDLVDSIGQIHMSWDNGRTLALVPEVDSFRKLTAKEMEEEQKAYLEELLKDAAAIEYKGIIFDDWNLDKDTGSVWAEMCAGCAEKHKDLISGELDDGDAIGICSVSGCDVSGLESDGKHYYIDFKPELIHPLTKEQLQQIQANPPEKKVSLDDRMASASARSNQQTKQGMETWDRYISFSEAER